jgi:RNA polymerase sigma factor (sigma-70 family)
MQYLVVKPSVGSEQVESPTAREAGSIKMMRGRFNGAVLHQFEQLFNHGTVAGLSEAELLERFVTHRDDSAFEALMTRHGPMVLGVCRQLLHDPNDVDDAFQATFLVLVRKAGTLRRCDLLGNWLYGVAYRVATRARMMASRRTARVAAFQRQFGGVGADGCGPADNRISNGMHDFELQPRLHEEVHRLPEKYRAPIVLCYFEGLTHEEAAARLGCPLGTVKGRLTRARDLLQRRLIRRGVALSGATLASNLVIRGVDAAVPTSLERITLAAARAVTHHAGLSLAAVSGVSLPVASLVEGVLQTMILKQVRTIVLPLLLAAGTVAAGVVVAATQLSGGPTDAVEQPVSQDLAKTKRAANQAARQTAKTKVSQSESPAQSNQAAQGSGMTGGMMAGGMGGGGMPAMMGGGGMPAMMGRGGMGGMMGGGMANMTPEDRNRVQRRSIAITAAQVAARDDNPQSKAVFKKLEEAIPMSFANETMLDDVLKYIKQATTTKTFSGIPIYVDPKGLNEAEKSLKSTVSIDLDGVPLKTTLRLALKQLDLAYCVRDGVLIISSVPGIMGELQEANSELGANDPPNGGLQ